MSANGEGSVTIGLLRERMPGERRVALTPPDIRRLVHKATFLVERGAGIEAGFADAEYAAAGARVANIEELIALARVVVKIRPPPLSLSLRPGMLLVSLGGRDEAVASLLREKSVVHLGLERLPRITRAQSMDVLSSQASVAGYAAVLEGARHLDVMLPMFITAAGTIKPARMMALGAGVAGLQAIATARRLGAITHGFDVREAAREQVESLGATFVAPEVSGVSGEAAGGYARVESWIDLEAPHGVVHADAFDASRKRIKQFDPKSVKKIQGQYQLESMEMLDEKTGSRTVIKFDLKRE